MFVIVISRCITFQLSSPIGENGSIILENDTLIFNGSPDLSQFTLLDHHMLARDSNTRIEVSFTLRRIFTSQLINTYIPTFGLLLIAIITLHFDNSKMELALGLTLTIMLVMYTMHQGISFAVTSTAYLKLLDYWLFFCLIMPFVIFMIEIYWLLEKNQHLNMSTDKVGWVEDEAKIKKNKNICLAITYTFTFTYIVAYIVISIMYYNS